MCVSFKKCAHTQLPHCTRSLDVVLRALLEGCNVQPNLFTRVSRGEQQKWPLLTGGLCSECQKLPVRVSRDNLRLSFVDSKPLLAGVLMHRFDCIYNGYVTLKFSFFSCDNKCYIPVCSMRASYPF